MSKHHNHIFNKKDHMKMESDMASDRPNKSLIKAPSMSSLSDGLNTPKNKETSKMKKKEMLQTDNVKDDSNWNSYCQEFDRYVKTGQNQQLRMFSPLVSRVFNNSSHGSINKFHTQHQLGRNNNDMPIVENGNKSHGKESRNTKLRQKFHQGPVDSDNPPKEENLQIENKMYLPKNHLQQTDFRRQNGPRNKFKRNNKYINNLGFNGAFGENKHGLYGPATQYYLQYFHGMQLPAPYQYHVPHHVPDCQACYNAYYIYPSNYGMNSTPMLQYSPLPFQQDGTGMQFPTPTPSTTPISESSVSELNHMCNYEAMSNEKGGLDPIIQLDHSLPAEIRMPNNAQMTSDNAPVAFPIINDQIDASYPVSDPLSVSGFWLQNTQNYQLHQRYPMDNLQLTYGAEYLAANSHLIYYGHPEFQVDHH